MVAPGSWPDLSTPEGLLLRFRLGAQPASTVLHATSTSLGSSGLVDRFYVTDGRLEVTGGLLHPAHPSLASAAGAFPETAPVRVPSDAPTSFGTLKALYRDR